MRLRLHNLLQDSMLVRSEVGTADSLHTHTHTYNSWEPLVTRNIFERVEKIGLVYMNLQVVLLPRKIKSIRELI